MAGWGEGGHPNKAKTQAKQVRKVLGVGELEQRPAERGIAAQEAEGDRGHLLLGHAQEFGFFSCG